MVGTRHSLPSAAEDDTANEPPDPAASKKARAALKKLAIDGTGALLGEKPQHEELETYHFRGAVYAVSKGTKAEWIEGEPERYRRRKEREKGQWKEGLVKGESVEREHGWYGRSSEDVGSRRDTPVEGTGRRVRFEDGSGEKGARKRKRSTGQDEEGDEDVQSRKRRRSVHPRAPTQYSSSPRPRQFALPPTIRKVKPANAFPLSRSHPDIDRRTLYNHKSSILNKSRNRTKDVTIDTQQNDQLRQTQRDLLALVRTNSAIEQRKRELKAVLLRRRLRELRRADSTAPPVPSPLTAGGPAVDLDDDTDAELLISSPPPGQPAAPSHPSPAYAINPHVRDPLRAESGVFAAKRALIASEEGRGVRDRRVRREMRVVRGWDAVADSEDQDEESEMMPSRSGRAYEASPPRLAVPRPGVPVGSTEADLPDEVRGRLGLFSEKERMEASEGWMGLWSAPRPDEDFPGVGSAVGEAGSSGEGGDGDGNGEVKE